MALTNETPKVVFFIVSCIAVGIGLGIAYACDRPLGYDFKWETKDIAPLWMVACASFIIQWIAFIPAAVLVTEKFYDFTGSCTYILLITYTLVMGGTYSPRQVILSSMGYIWAIRLGSFLLTRICKDGKDARFDEAKLNPIRFWNFWTIQGLWVFFTALPIFVVNASKSDTKLQVNDYVGVGGGVHH